MPGRYVIIGGWDTEQVTTPIVGVNVITESATLKDTRGGYEYRQGAWRVRVEGDLPDKPRTRTFKGESAWSAAERWAGDLVWQLRRR